jgi:hypothetical protein
LLEGDRFWLEGAWCLGGVQCLIEGVRLFGGARYVLGSPRGFLGGAGSVRHFLGGASCLLEGDRFWLEDVQSWLEGDRCLLGAA